MIPPQQAQQEYIITEAQLETLAAGCQNDYGDWCKGVDESFIDTIRSHPHTGAPSEERIGSIRTNVFMDEQKEWLIERVNAGMGEWEYVMSYLGEYFATAPSELIAKEIQEAYSDRATIAAQAREQVLEELSLPRDAVVRFSRIMENKLCEKDSIRDGWDDCDPVWLFERAEQEMRELKSEITVYMNHSSLSPKWLTIAERVQREAADVANFCMMISDNMESLRKTPKEQEQR
jgi:methionine synthase II (cobalamin-independent)